jgi:sugar lactone lactonase YvrE
MTTAALAKITTIANFPEHFFLENLAVRTDGSILVSALNRNQLWYVPAPTDHLPVDPVLVHTFEDDHLAMGIVETEPDIFYVTTLGRATLDRFDMRGWSPSAPAKRHRVLTFDPPAAPNGSCVIAAGVILIADTVQGLIWRVDLADDGLTAAARVWLQHDTMAPGGDGLAPVTLSPTVQIPFPGVNGIRYASRTNFVYYSASAQELLMRVAVDPVTHEPVAEPEFVTRAIHAVDDFCIDEDAGVAYLTTHIDNTVVRVPLDPGAPRLGRTIVAGDPFTDQLIGPSSAVWGRGRGDYGRVAYVTTDGGETLAPPDGVIRPAQIVRLEFAGEGALLP